MRHEHMNSFKLENMSVTVPRAEGNFWRRLAVSKKVRGQLARSRGDFQKHCMALGLAQLCKRSARELARIRCEHSPRAMAATVLLLSWGFCATGNLVLARHQHDLRTAGRVVRSAKNQSHVKDFEIEA